jgi:histidyl-tRNA synthetase
MAIEDNFYLNGCCDNDVISLSSKVYKVETFKEAINDFLEAQETDSASKNLSIKLNERGILTNRNEIFALINKGTESEILKAATNSNGWQKGRLKLKVVIEFIPDEPEIPEYQSPLDEIRREMQQNS